MHFLTRLTLASSLLTISFASRRLRLLRLRIRPLQLSLTWQTSLLPRTLRQMPLEPTMLLRLLLFRTLLCRKLLFLPTLCRILMAASVLIMASRIRVAAVVSENSKWIYEERMGSMVELTYNPVQTIPAGSSAILNTTIGCPYGCIINRNESGICIVRENPRNRCSSSANY